MAPRLVFVHGIGGTRPGDRERWISALAEGARQAGHSKAALNLEQGRLANVVLASYGDLFEPPQAQGSGSLDLDADAAALLSELLAEIVETHSAGPGCPEEIKLTRALAQLRPPGEAQGSGDVVRRAINAATTLLGAGPWARAGQWASGRFLARDLAQVARYLNRREPDREMRTLDSRIRAVVAQALGPGPAIVVAHSLGSVVAFETLHDHQGTIPLWVTLGSPLGMRAVVWPKLRPRPPTTPEAVRRWLNYWDRDDVIAVRPILESDLAANTAGVLPRSIRVDSDGLWVHTATKYLSKAEVAGPVIEAVQFLGGAA